MSNGVSRRNFRTNMINLLEKAWSNGKLPIIHGIVKGNGLYYEIENLKNRIGVAKPIPFLFDFSENSFSRITSLFEIRIGEYTLYCGEGSWGGDGFIYVENTETKKLLWCIFNDTINPIIKCTLSDDKLIAENNNECQYIFDFENPERLKCLKL